MITYKQISKFFEETDHQEIDFHELCNILYQGYTSQELYNKLHPEYKPVLSDEWYDRMDDDEYYYNTFVKRDIESIPSKDNTIKDNSIDSINKKLEYIVEELNLLKKLISRLYEKDIRI